MGSGDGVHGTGWWLVGVGKCLTEIKSFVSAATGTGRCFADGAVGEWVEVGTPGFSDRHSEFEMWK